MTTTGVYANMLAMLEASRMDGERLRRIAEADTVEAALKMLGDYGYTYVSGGDVDSFIIAQTDALIDFIRENSAFAAAADVLTAPFWYNNVKLAYKSRFAEMPENSYYRTELDCAKIAEGDYSDCDKYLRTALEALDAAEEKNPREIDLAVTRAMYAYILSRGTHTLKKYFRAEIDYKNILAAARMRRLGLTKFEFIDGGHIKTATLEDAVTAKEFSLCFVGTPYEDVATRIEESGFKGLGRFESEADEYLFFLTDGMCAKMSTVEPFLNYYTRARIELKAIKTALVCVKTNSRDEFLARMPMIYG